MTDIILPHSGYKKLIVYKIKRCHLPRHHRVLPTVPSAARGPYGRPDGPGSVQLHKQNIAEGSAAAGTSLERQIRLTNVARATLDELLEDYLDFLKAHGDAEWPMESGKKTTAREFAKAHAGWEDWQPLFESRPAETLCNLMIVPIQQGRYMRDRMLQWQADDFKAHGGVRERMYAARAETRGEEWEKTVCSMLSLAKTPGELADRLSSVIDSARQSARSLAKRNGWRDFA